jgi:hypothetical protein
MLSEGWHQEDPRAAHRREVIELGPGRLPILEPIEMVHESANQIRLGVSGGGRVHEELGEPLGNPEKGPPAHVQDAKTKLEHATLLPSRSAQAERARATRSPKEGPSSRSRSFS